MMGEAYYEETNITQGKSVKTVFQLRKILEQLERSDPAGLGTLQYFVDVVRCAAIQVRLARPMRDETTGGDILYLHVHRHTPPTRPTVKRSGLIAKRKLSVAFVGV
jgi:hypothetical protein